MIESPIVQPVEEPRFEPNEAQLLRRKRLRRYNWLTLFFPTVILALLALLLLGGMLWLTWEGTPTADRWRVFVSAASDIIVILTTLVILPLCLVLPAGAIAFIATVRQRGWTPIASLQRWLWRLESGVEAAQLRIDETAGRSAKAVIKGRAWIAGLEARIRWLRYWLTGR